MAESGNGDGITIKIQEKMLRAWIYPTIFNLMIGTGVGVYIKEQFRSTTEETTKQVKENRDATIDAKNTIEYRVKRLEVLIEEMRRENRSRKK